MEVASELPVVEDENISKNSFQDFFHLEGSENSTNNLFELSSTQNKFIETENQNHSSSSSILGKRSLESPRITAKKKKTTDENPLCKWDGCNESFTSLSSLGSHLTSHIKQQKTQNRSNKKSGYICKWEDCTRGAPFKGCYNLEHHLRYQHTGEKPFQCKYCPSSFAQRSDMSEHLFNIHNRKPQTKKRGRTKNTQTQLTPFPNDHTNSDKVQQLMTPRSRPIPILPAPQITPYLDYNTYVPTHTIAGPLRQSLIPSDPSNFLSFNPAVASYATKFNLVESGENNFQTQIDDSLFINNIYFHAQAQNSFGAPQSNLIIPNTSSSSSTPNTNGIRSSSSTIFPEYNYSIDSSHDNQDQIYALLGYSNSENQNSPNNWENESGDEKEKDKED